MRWQLRLPGQRSLRGRRLPPHDGVRSAGVGMSTTRFLRSEDHSRNDAPAIVVTSPWQELLSAQARRNLSRSNYAAVTAASLFDQRNSVPSRHIRWRMTASFLATATVAFWWPIFRASRVPHAFSVDQRDTRFRMMPAASYRYVRVSRSPQREILPGFRPTGSGVASGRHRRRRWTSGGSGWDLRLC